MGPDCIPDTLPSGSKRAHLEARPGGRAHHIRLAGGAGDSPRVGNPRHSRLHNNYGHAIAALGRHEEAVEHFRQALSLQPGWPLAAHNLAGSLAALGRFAEAAEAVEQAASLIEASDPDGAAGLRRQAERYRADMP